MRHVRRRSPELQIAASLLDGQPGNLYETIPGFHRDLVQLVLATMAYASGSHEHTGGLAPNPQGHEVNAAGGRRTLPGSAASTYGPQMAPGLRLSE